MWASVDSATDTTGAGKAGRSGRPRSRSVTPRRRPRREDRLDLVEELHLHLVRADRTDGLVELDVVPVDGVHDPTLDHGDDVGRGDRAEQLAFLAGARRDHQRPAGDELGRERLVHTLALGEPVYVRPLERFGVADGALLGLDRALEGSGSCVRSRSRQPRRAPGVPELVDGLLQDQTSSARIREEGHLAGVLDGLGHVDADAARSCPVHPPRGGVAALGG